MIEVTENIVLDESEIEEQFIHASGPGGQHVNKASTAVQLFFDVAHSPSLPDDVRQRLMQQAGSRITAEGVLIIESQRFRNQDRNRQDARDRLVALIRKAAIAPRVRRPTRPTQAARERRLQRKGRRGEIKRLRRRPVE